MQVGAAGPDFGSAPGPSRYPRVSSPINDQSVLGGNDECVQCPRQRGPLRGQPGQQVPVDPLCTPLLVRLLGVPATGAPRSQRRTVDSGRSRLLAMLREMAPLALVTSAFPITSVVSARWTVSSVGSRI